MLRACVTLLLLAGPVVAQAPALRFQWQKGQVLEYRVTQTTAVTDTSLDDKGKPVTSEIRLSLALTKRWTVRDVDAAGTATLEQSVTKLKETRVLNGTTLTLDSDSPADAAKMTYLNKPVLTLKVDARGRVSDVQGASPKAAARVNEELPFRVVLPEAAPAAGQKWSRPFTITLDPPDGTGDAYEAEQAYTLKGATKEGVYVVGVATALKAPPKAADEKRALAPRLWAGDVYFDPAGRYHAARLTAKAELVNHAGEGTKFVYESVYSEDAVGK